MELSPLHSTLILRFKKKQSKQKTGVKHEHGIIITKNIDEYLTPTDLTPVFASSFRHCLPLSFPRPASTSCITVIADLQAPHLNTADNAQFQNSTHTSLRNKEQADKQAGRQADRLTNRQAGRQTG